MEGIPIPEGVTFDLDNLMFFGTQQEDELGTLFFRQWISRSDEFPVHDYSKYQNKTPGTLSTN